MCLSYNFKKCTKFVNLNTKLDHYASYIYDYCVTNNNRVSNKGFNSPIIKNPLLFKY